MCTYELKIIENNRKKEGDKKNMQGLLAMLSCLRPRLSSVIHV